jgi:predicted nucleic acid-binding protein
MAYYLDTSAAVKLVLSEAGSAALLRWAADRQDRIVSSDLLRTELQQATRRGAPQQMERARAVLESVTLVSLARSTFDRAGELEPESMRSLDALHLAAALELGDDLEGFVTYDDRLAEAVRRYGIPVIAPR